MSNTPYAGYRPVPEKELRGTVSGIFAALGVPSGDADIVADVLVAADLRGIDSHGVGRVRLYVQDIRTGVICPVTEPKIVRETATTAVVDGGNGLGQVVARWAMQLCIAKAREAGSGSVTVRGSNHFGIAGYYAMMALEHDQIGLALTNSSPVTVPTYARTATIGSNPIALAVPAARERPYVLDMATATVPLGRLEVMMRAGLPIPLGWGVDREGRPTTDPEEAHWHGGLMPLGGTDEMRGYKGYGLALGVDILSSVLSGASFATQIVPWQNVRTDPANIGHFFQTWRIDAFMPTADFKARMDEIIGLMHDAPRAAGADRIYVPGEKEYELMERYRAGGVPVQEQVLDALCQIGSELGVDATALS